MNEIKSFTFYKNYYELIDNLPKEDKRLMLEVIVDYIFRDVEPIGLEKMNLAIWNNIKMPLDTSKKQALNVGKRWEEKDTKEDTKSNTKKDTNNNFLFLISNLIKEGLLREKVEKWLKYKTERKEYYKETGFKSLLTQIQNNVNKYGEDKVIELIEDSMANNYKGIIFDKLKKQKQVERKAPEWVGKKIEEKYLDDEQEALMEKLLRGEELTEEEKNILHDDTRMLTKEEYEKSLRGGK